MIQDYNKARSLALKHSKNNINSNIIYFHKPIINTIDLGILDIPIDMIIGSIDENRCYSFSYDYLPLLDSDSEFASKWSRLYDSLLKDGLQQPIVVYEYHHYFYVKEGNKRVSVLKYLKALTISARVIRINDDKDSEYQLFINFYNYVPMYEFNFTQASDYDTLLQLIQDDINNLTKQDLVKRLKHKYYCFYNAYYTYSKDNINISDAFILYCQIYGYDNITNCDYKTLYNRVNGMYHEILLLNSDNKDIYRTSVEYKRTTLINRIISKQIKVAFIYDDNPGNSQWVLDHDIGRIYVQQVFNNKVKIDTYITKDIQAIKGYDLVFTTSYTMMNDTLKAALKNSDTTYLNCSIALPVAAVSSYYGRMYEAKFLMGLIAGILSDSNNIGYCYDNNLKDNTCEINAFASGISLVNNKAKVILVNKYNNYLNILKENNCDIFVGPDLPDKNNFAIFGLCKIKDNNIINLATPIHNWGLYYECLIRNYMQSNLYNGSYKKQGKALHDIWGMDSGVIDLVMSARINNNTKLLVNTFKSLIINNKFNIFSYISDTPLSMEQILAIQDYHPIVVRL